MLRVARVKTRSVRWPGVIKAIAVDSVLSLPCPSLLLSVGRFDFGYFFRVLLLSCSGLLNHDYWCDRKSFSVGPDVLIRR